MKPSRILSIATLLGTLLALGGLVYSVSPRSEQSVNWRTSEEVVAVSRKGKLDVTLLFAADLHMGFERTVSVWSKSAGRKVKRRFRLWPHHKKFAKVMMAISGRSYPAALGGKVASPLALFVAGDITEDSRSTDWRAFESLFGTGQTKGPFPFPVHAIPGNHDVRRSLGVLMRIVQREKGYFLHKEYGDLVVLSLGLAPDEAALRWLKEQLARIGRERPIVLVFHYPLLGPLLPEPFKSSKARRTLPLLLKGFNVVALFHGHYHASGYYKYQGLHVYNVGSVKYTHEDFAVLRVTDTHIQIAFFNVELGRWWWFHKRPINGKMGKTLLKKLHARPKVPYPKSWTKLP